MAIFGPIPWVNPFGKVSIFGLFETSCFDSLERHFFVLEYRKRHFPGLYCLKKKSWKNGHFLDQNHGLTPLQKCQFFDFLNFFFFNLESGCFVVEYRRRQIRGLNCLKNNLKNGHFWTKIMGQPVLKNLNFFDFSNFLLS